MSWTDERVETLKTMWSEGKSASQIAKELGGVTRNAVIGKVHRLGLSNRVGGEHPDDLGGARRGDPRRRDPRADAGSRDAAAGHRPQPPGPGQGPDPGGPRQADRPAAAAALGLRDQRRGAGQPRRGREESPPSQPDAAHRAHLQMAGRRPRHRRLLVLRPAHRAPASPTARPTSPSPSSRCPPAATAAPEAADPLRRAARRLDIAAPGAIVAAGRGKRPGDADEHPARRQGRARHRRELGHRPRARRRARPRRRHASRSPPAPPSGSKPPAPAPARPRR